MKCKQAYLGGGGARMGHGSAFNKCACEHMRCTACDFTVMRIDGKRWKDELDYLFLRNHMPFLDKLAPMLEDDPFTCAYACQCSSKVGWGGGRGGGGGGGGGGGQWVRLARRPRRNHSPPRRTLPSSST